MSNDQDPEITIEFQPDGEMMEVIKILQEARIELEQASDSLNAATKTVLSVVPKTDKPDEFVFVADAEDDNVQSEP